MSNYDHYAEVENLVEILRKENLNGHADSLVNAMQEGATGTEIFMALRWNLKKILESNICSDISEAKAKKLYKELDMALQ